MIDVMTSESASTRSHKGLDGETRRVAAAAVAAAGIGWWPAFTMGVYGVVFFEQHLALWAVATSAFVAAGIAGGRRVWRRPAMWALLLPSLWLLMIWLLPVGGTSSIYQAMFWFGVVITLFGLPALAAFLIRLLIPDAEHLRPKEAAIAIGAVGLVMLVSYTLGTQHPRMMTCEDFSISGNFAPENCSPGTGTTVR